MSEDDSNQAEAHEFACVSGHHDRCLHVQRTSGWRLIVGEDSGPDPATSPLCGCICHADCPLTGQHNGAGWPERCTCQGTAAAGRLGSRSRDEPTDLLTTIRQGLDRNRRQRQAREAAQARASGRSRDEVSAILDEEWTRHGLVPPTEPIRGMWLDRLTGPASNRIEDARVTADVGLALLKLPFRLASVFERHASARNDTGNGHDGLPVYRIQSGRDSVEVVLDNDAQARIATIGDDGLFAPVMLRHADVEVRKCSDGSLEVWEDPTADALSSTGPGRLGVISTEDAGPFLRPVAAAGRVGQRAVCGALRSQAADGHCRLHLYVPAGS